ncbi:hypothetical protein Tco_0034198 [Tanacetum coccineum]
MEASIPDTTFPIKRQKQERSLPGGPQIYLGPPGPPPDHEKEKLHADDERMVKEKESVVQVSLKNEISSLKSEVLSLSQKEGLKVQILKVEA